MVIRTALGLVLLAGMAWGALAAEESSPSNLRKWSDASGKFSVHAEFIALKDDMVELKKADGSTVAVALERLSAEDQKIAQELADKPAADAIELKYDDGKAVGRQSFAGGGHTVQFETPAGNWQLTSIKLHGSRYGMPVPPKEDIVIWVCDDQGKVRKELKVPYKLVKRKEEKWVTMKVPPTAVPQKFRLCFYFNAEVTKGIYVSYDGKATGQSFVGTPDEGFEPFPQGNWLIRATIEPAKGDAKEEESPFQPQS